MRLIFMVTDNCENFQYTVVTSQIWLVDHCSNLSITSEVPSHWRAYERAQSRSLLTHAVFAI